MARLGRLLVLTSVLVWVGYLPNAAESEPELNLQLAGKATVGGMGFRTA